MSGKAKEGKESNMAEPEDRLTAVIEEVAERTRQHIREYAEREMQRFNKEVTAITGSMAIFPPTSIMSVLMAGGAVRQYVVESMSGAWLGELQSRAGQTISIEMPELRREWGVKLRVTIIAEPVGKEDA